MVVFSFFLLGSPFVADYALNNFFDLFFVLFFLFFILILFLSSGADVR